MVETELDVKILQLQEMVDKNEKDIQFYKENHGDTFLINVLEEENIELLDEIEELLFKYRFE